MTDELKQRIDVLEAAVKALARAELGDSPGHPFRGNQYGGGSDGEADQIREATRSAHAEQDARQAQRVSDTAQGIVKQYDKLSDDKRGMAYGDDSGPMIDDPDYRQDLRDTYGISGPPNNSSMEVDLAGDNHDASAKAVEEIFGVKSELVDPHGPGGGNPVYEFKGDEEQLFKIADEYEAGNGWSLF